MAGYAGSDDLRGGRGTTAEGLAGDDAIFGGAGRDALFGGAGDDWLDGGGARNLTGGPAATLRLPRDRQARHVTISALATGNRFPPRAARRPRPRVHLGAEAEHPGPAYPLRRRYRLAALRGQGFRHPASGAVGRIGEDLDLEAGDFFLRLIAFVVRRGSGPCSRASGSPAGRSSRRRCPRCRGASSGVFGSS